MNALEGEFSGMDLQVVDRLPAQEGGKQSTQPKDVIQVTVGDEDVVEVLESQPGLQDLALGALAAVDEKAMLIMFHQLGG
jgi:hypothetical protein